MMDNTEIIEKGYRINLQKIDEGFAYSDVWCHAPSLGAAKKKLLDSPSAIGMKLSNGDDITFLNIPVVRASQYDLVMFQGKRISRARKEEMEKRQKRFAKINAIIDDKAVTHCYITKGPLYYRGNYNGYTLERVEAGVYEKRSAASHAIHSDDVTLVPIQKEEHNALITESIEQLKKRIIP